MGSHSIIWSEYGSVTVFIACPVAIFSANKEFIDQQNDLLKNKRR
jgi:hypothetical protein